MSRKLIVSAVAASFAAAMLAIAGVLTGAEINLGAETTYILSDYAPVVALFGLAGGAVMGARDPDTYEKWELVVVAGAISIPALVYADVAPLIDVLDQHHPYSGLGAAVIGFVAYHAVTFRTNTKKSSVSITGDE